MRFTTAWSDVLSQNLTLRVMLLCLSICTVFVSILAVQQGFKEPIVVERGCYSKLVKPASSQHTKEEMDSFVRLALSQRFDTDVEASPEVIGQDELRFKKQEQQELTSKNMTQRILVGKMVAIGDTITVASDRVISVGLVRSALSFPLTVTVGSTNRTASNPYGLLVTKVSQASKKEEGQ